MRHLTLGLAATLLACAGCWAPEAVVDGPLRINELVASNHGVWVDGAGETDDWIELVHVGDARIWLDGYTLGDGRSARTLPPVPLLPGEHILLWADGDLAQGDHHLPFNLSSQGERLELRDRSGTLIDRVDFPPLLANEAFGRFPDGSRQLGPCRFATPERANPDRCGAPPPPVIEGAPFERFDWPVPWPPAPAPLAISEVALRPAAFVEVHNRSPGPVVLAEYALGLSVHAPGRPWPTMTDGASLALPDAVLAPGERAVVPVTELEVGAIAATVEFEGVVSLFARATSAAIDRVDFMAWPVGAVLARPTADTTHAFCTGATPGFSNETCAPLASRPVGNRLRHLRTPGDFSSLAAGGTQLGLEAVKFVVDMAAGDAVHLLGSAWDLHYTFVREEIELLPHLDRCDPAQNSVFHRGWSLFSREQYAVTDTRRYLLGTLVAYAGSGEELRTVEFVTGDRIRSDQMHRAFFGVAAHLVAPRDWALRPQSDAQDGLMREIEGTAPIVSQAAPLQDVQFQPLTPAVGFGVLRFVPARELSATSLGRDSIVVTDDVPNDIALVGGLITEALQTPLSHVNILSRGRGTPNMALRDARRDPGLAPLFGQLVRLEVRARDFSIRPADVREAEAFWAAQRPAGPRAVARVDFSVRGPVDLAGRGLGDLPALGAKAAQLAELGRVSSTRGGCPGPVRVPVGAFAIPVVHYAEHLRASGAEAELQAQMARPEFRTDSAARSAGLARVRALIAQHPVDAALLADVRALVRERFGAERVRLRSSSNAEDLADFSGAGLYTSASASVDDPERRVSDAMRTVWASLWNQRAYDERERAHIEQSSVAMGVLVHGAFLSELANGVGVSRNIFDPTRGDIHYFNLQVGEATVTNPAPGVTTEEYLFRFGRSPRVVYQSRSSLTPFDVVSPGEAGEVACVLAAIHEHFQPLIDPARDNRWFAMDIEFKLVGAERGLVVKQARPYTFGEVDAPVDCREF